MAPAATRLTTRALNRALLARQGLLERGGHPLVETVEAIGAVQAQHWPAPPVALWSRMGAFAPEDLHRALERRELVLGILLRGTLHLVSAREHPAYAAVAEASGASEWRRVGTAVAADTVVPLRAALLERTRTAPRTPDELAAHAEAWVAAHPEGLAPEEVHALRERRWRPVLRWSGFVRAPADGRWGAKTPAASVPAPGAEALAPATPTGAGSLDGPASSPMPGAVPLAPPLPSPAAHVPPSGDDALVLIVRRHLGAFGPATPDDVATWTGARPAAVRTALARLAPELVPFEDEAGRALLDLADAPRPGPEVAAPPRFLPAFDSILLAHAAKHRARILPEGYRALIYEPKNLRIKPTFLLDGLVAGLWSTELTRGEATITLTPFASLPRARKALTAEAERLARFLHPKAKAHRVLIAR